MSLLQHLDDDWLPRLAAKAQRAVATTRATIDRVVGPRTTTGHAVRTEPALAGSIAAVTAAAVLLAAFGTHEPHDGEKATPQPAAQAPPAMLTLGPQPGTSVATYLTNAAFDLRNFGEISHGKPGYALVNLTAYVTPATIESTIAGVSVARAYVRVPSTTLLTSIYPVGLLGTFKDLETGMQSQSRFAGINAKTYAQIVAGFNATTKQQKVQKQLYRELAEAATFESTALAQPAGCACVFAVVVQANAVQLGALARLPGVRSVDPAAPSASLDQLAVIPLRPDITTVVPRPGVLGVG